MLPTASLALLFLAAGLLVVAGLTIGRRPGPPVSPVLGAVMAGITGLALGFLALVMPVMPLLLFPIAIGAVLVVEWARRRTWPALGAFLLGAGALWAAGQAMVRLNGPVSIAGWSPVPLALGVAAAILGVALLLVTDVDAQA